MNKIKNIVFTVIALVLFQSVALAQDGAGEFGDGENPLDTPIDSFVWVLLVVGLVYVFYKYSSLKSKEDRVS